MALAMPRYREEYEHPTQASRVRLNIYPQEPPSEPPVAGLGPRAPGYLLTEDRVGTVTVVSSLGYFPSRDEAMDRLRRRADELIRQRYRPLGAAA